MQGKMRPWIIHTLPIACWSDRDHAWQKLNFPLRLNAGKEVWLDLGVVVYGMIELHFEPSKIFEIQVISTESLFLFHKDMSQAYTYEGHGHCPVILGQQVHRFIALKSQQDCTLSNFLIWTHTQPNFPACPVQDHDIQQIWQGACAMTSLCWQDGLWYQPTLWPYDTVYGLWIQGPVLHDLGGGVEDWKRGLHHLLQRCQDTPWLDASPLATLWLLMSLADYYDQTQDEFFFQQYTDQFKNKVAFVLSHCGEGGRVHFPAEPEHTLWPLLLNDDAEELIMVQQILVFWAFSKLKHLSFHLGWVDLVAKIEHLVASREEFWLFPVHPVTAALAILAEIPDRRFFFLPTVQKYTLDLSSLELSLIVLALCKKGETDLGKEILRQFWAHKNPLNPPPATDPSKVLEDGYIMQNWDCAPILLINNLYKS